MSQSTMPSGQWELHSGPIGDSHVTDLAREVAEQHSLDVDLQTAARRITLRGTHGTINLQWRAAAAKRPETLRYLLPPPATTEVLVTWDGDGLGEVARLLGERVRAHARPYTESELDSIVDSMPLVEQFSKPAPEFDRWAVIFRDHYVEHSVGFLLGLERAGVPPEWIYALTKGDRTRYRHRIHATLRQRLYASEILDNAAIDGHLAGQFTEQVDRVNAELSDFITRAHQAGRKVLVVDDGGLVAQGYGTASSGRPSVDAAIELTVSGLKRIQAVPDLGIPVFNLARSALKTSLGYPEIADSCVRRLREMLPGHKFIGRTVLVIGFGTLGARVAVALRELGCQVAVVDTDILALIETAEHGFATYRSAAEALRSTSPFLVVSATGEVALTAEDLLLLPDGAHLAGFATKDFSVLTDPANDYPCTDIPEIGRQYRLPNGRAIVMFGDGRSLNLFEADSISGEGYDAYRAGTIVAAKLLCGDLERFSPGVYLREVDEAIAESGLFEAYYERYLTNRPTEPATDPAVGLEPARRACVIGYGVAGRLHGRILSELGLSVTVVDPKRVDVPRGHRPLVASVAELPDRLVEQIELWSICSPNPDHLTVLQAVLERNPAARVLLEKPACQSHEIDQLEALIAAHPQARIVVNDQYRFAKVVPALSRVVADLEPGRPMDRLSIVFTKDRRDDIAGGRFVDREYGVLGYEWLHMLTLLRGLLPPDVMSGYLRSEVGTSELWATYDPRLFVSALMERSLVASGTRVDLYSSIVQPSMPLGLAAAGQVGSWHPATGTADHRHRHITVEAGDTRFVARLDPVTAGGWQLPRNHHRITAERDGRLVHDEVIQDSPLESSIRDAVERLLGAEPAPALDLQPLRRIGAIAVVLRTQQPSVQAPVAVAAGA